MDGKADADINALRPTLPWPNVKLLLQAKVTRLLTERHAGEISGVEAEIAGERRVFRGHLVVVAAGAINSAALLLRSASDKHPRGLANSPIRSAATICGT